MGKGSQGNDVSGEDSALLEAVNWGTFALKDLFGKLVHYRSVGVEEVRFVLSCM